MKNLCNFLLILIMLNTLFCPLGASAQIYVWQSLLPNDAIQVVRGFEGSPSLNVTVNQLGTGTIDQPSDYGRSQQYWLSANRYNYRVSAFNQYQFSRLDTLFTPRNYSQFYEQDYDPQTLVQRMMPQSVVELTAIQFMQSHFPHPEILSEGKPVPHFVPGNQVSETTTFLDYYTFSFYQDCGNNVIGPSYCSVRVDTVKGQVVSYSQAYYPVLVVTTPQLSASQATASAVNTISNLIDISSNAIVTPIGTDVPHITSPDAMGAETLAYGIEFSVSEDNQTLAITYDADVDANNGNVLFWDELESSSLPSKEHRAFHLDHFGKNTKTHVSQIQERLNFKFNGRSTKLAYPCICIKNQPYIYAGYIGRSNVSTLTTKSKKIEFQSLKHQVSFRFDTKTYYIDGLRHNMGVNPMLLNITCYVPLDVMQTVLGGKWRYDAKAQTVRYDPPPVKHDALSN